MESVQTSLFQRFGTEFEQVARHRAGKPVPVNSNVNQDSGEGPATLASKPSRPALTPCIHTFGSRPSGTANRRTGLARPSLHGPARSDVESLSATPSPVKDRTSLTDPTTAAGSRRLRLLPRILFHRWNVLRPEPPPSPNKDASLHRIPMAVGHGDSGRSRHHAWHRSRLHCRTIPLCRHRGRFPSRRSHETASMNPPHSRPDSIPRTG